MKKIEKLLREAYRAGQDSVTCGKIIHSGKAKPKHWCEDYPCKHKIAEKTDSAEDELVTKLLLRKET